MYEPWVKFSTLTLYTEESSCRLLAHLFCFHSFIFSLTHLLIYLPKFIWPVGVISPDLAMRSSSLILPILCIPQPPGNTLWGQRKYTTNDWNERAHFVFTYSICVCSCCYKLFIVCFCLVLFVCLFWGFFKRGSELNVKRTCKHDPGNTTAKASLMTGSTVPRWFSCRVWLLKTRGWVSQ